MTDRELLELAAKAAGYVLNGHTQKDWALCVGGREWNPLTDDGDAFRLMAKLELTVVYSMRDPSSTKMISVCVSRQDTVVVYEAIGTDQNAATRRAIVRAAAEIGEKKQ